MHCLCVIADQAVCLSSFSTENGREHSDGSYERNAGECNTDCMEGLSAY